MSAIIKSVAKESMLAVTPYQIKIHVLTSPKPSSQFMFIVLMNEPSLNVGNYSKIQNWDA